MSNAQVQKYKYNTHKHTNTAYDEVPERPNMWYIFEKGIAQGFQKLYFHVSNAQIQKYKFTITQIRHLTKCLKDPTCGIFLKRGVLQHHSATSASEMAFDICSCICPATGWT